MYVIIYFEKVILIFVILFGNFKFLKLFENLIILILLILIMKFIFGIFYLGKRCVIFVDGLIDDLMMFMKFVIFLVCF